jgi:hypothetical protein
MVKDRRQQIYLNVFICLRALCGEYMLSLLLILISKSWGCPLGSGMPFLDNDTCVKGVIYFCRDFLLCMMSSMDGWTDGSHEKASQKTITTSFTIIKLYYLEGFCFLSKDFFLKIIFLHGEIFEFP